DGALDHGDEVLERLAGTIGRAIAGQEGVKMETNVFVKDADGDIREHDILITHTEGLRVTRTAVECKDHGRKIGKPEMDAFRSKCQDTGIHKGVLVSSSGFAKSALKASKRTNIQCLELSTVDSFDWVGTSILNVYTREFSNIDILVFAKTPMALPFRVYAPDGQQLEVENFRNVAQEGINDDPGLMHVGMDKPATANIQWTPPDRCYTIDADEVRHDVDYFVLVATWTVRNTPQPFDLHRYLGDSGELQVATSEFEVPGLSGKLVMIRDEENIRVALSPHPKPSKLIEN
ncbi:MAG: hypothetical protein EOO23_05700, partial [Comamonadaceae bacterium]